MLFSYVQTDEWCERYETSRTITTSRAEGCNHLTRKLARDARNRQKVSKGMYDAACRSDNQSVQDGLIDAHTVLSL